MGEVVPERPALSVVLSVRNGWDDTFRALLAVLAERLPGCETLVVDDGSSDETPLALPRLQGVQVLRADAPGGLVRARNAAARVARGSWLLFLGNGLEPAPGCLRRLLDAARETPVEAAVPLLLDPAGAPLPLPAGAPGPSATEPGLLVADGLLVSAAAFQAVGGLDEAFHDRWAEADLCRRLASRGLRVLHVPEAGLRVREPWGVALPPTPEDAALAARRWGAAPPPPDGAVPRFTVLVPTYNQASYLPAALDSLLAQTRADWEAVVVDDGSTDGTGEVLAAWAARDRRIRPFRKENGGVATALNEALLHARGEWICWLSSDDLLEPDALQAFADGVAAHPGCRFFHADFSELHERTGRKVPSPADRAARLPRPPAQTLAFFAGNYVNGITICVHRTAFDQVGGFDPQLRWAQDVDMWLRISSRFPPTFLPHRTSVTRVHGGMGTAAFPQAGIFEVARACLQFLGRHRFPELFPQLDLARRADAFTAVQATLSVGLDPRAHAYQGVGLVPALLDRLVEWLTTDCPAPLRAELLRAMSPALSELARSGIPAPLAAPLARLAEARSPIPYVPVDPLDAMVAEMERRERHGDPRGAALIRRYLARAAPARLAA